MSVTWISDSLTISGSAERLADVDLDLLERRRWRARRSEDAVPCTARAACVRATACRSTARPWPAGSIRALLDPLVAALGRHALAAAKVHANDTPVAVLDPGRGRTKSGRLWVYVRDDRPEASKDAPAVWFSVLA